MSTVMLTVTRDPSRASLKEVKEDLGLADAEIDGEFGVVNIDPKGNRYAIMVEEGASARLTDRPEVEGPFANPPIEPFGPPQR